MFRLSTFMFCITVSMLLLTLGCRGGEELPDATTQPAPLPTDTIVLPTEPPVVEQSVNDCANSVINPGFGDGEYIINIDNPDCYEVGDWLVAYFTDIAGGEFVAAVLQIVEKNPNNWVALVVFRHAEVDIDATRTLSALRIDRRTSQVDLGRLVPADESYVGFVLKEEGQIKIRPEAALSVDDELEIIRLNVTGSPISFNPPVLLTIGRIEPGGLTALVQQPLNNSWADINAGLLIFSDAGREEDLMVGDYMRTDICVRKGYKVELAASGNIVVGEFVGEVSVEGAETFFEVIPIDPKYDIVTAFPHGTLMVRLETDGVDLRVDENWMGYHETREFEAEANGCLAFDINDIDNADNSGAFTVHVVTTP